MKVEIKNWFGVVILLCLGFIVGRMNILPDVKAEPEEPQIGRYQLVSGEYDITQRAFDKTHPKDSLSTGLVPNYQKTLFRIDTMTGEVDRYQFCETIITQDMMTVTYVWEPITGKIQSKR